MSRAEKFLAVKMVPKWLNVWKIMFCSFHRKILSSAVSSEIWDSFIITTWIPMCIWRDTYIHFLSYTHTHAHTHLLLWCRWGTPYSLRWLTYWSATASWSQMRYLSKQSHWLVQKCRGKGQLKNLGFRMLPFTKTLSCSKKTLLAPNSKPGDLGCSHSCRLLIKWQDWTIELLIHLILWYVYGL